MSYATRAQAALDAIAAARATASAVTSAKLVALGELQAALVDGNITTPESRPLFQRIYQAIQARALDSRVDIVVNSAQAALALKADTADVIAALAGKAAPAIATLVVPTTGQTQTFTTTKAWQVIACNHTSTIAAQTFVFPTDANSAIGQELRIFSRSIITTITLTLNSNTILGLALTTLPANGNVAWRKVAASTWARIQ